MATPPEEPSRPATGTPVSSSMATPAAATTPAYYTGTPTSARPIASTMSRPMATMSLFQTPSSRTATLPTNEDGGDGSQGRESHRRSSQIDDRETLKQAMLMMQAAQQPPSEQQGTTVRQQIEDVPVATNKEVHNETTTEGEDMVDSHQDIQKSIPPQAQPPRSTPQGTSNARITRSGSTSQNKGGNSNVAFTTTKLLKENAARKRSAANSRKNAQEEA